MAQDGTGKSLDMASTADLLVELQNGNGTAREILFERYLQRLQRWARGRLPRGARGLMDTDDIVQQSLTNVLGKLDSFQPRHAGGFQGYLRQVVLNQVRDQIRAAARQPVGERDGVDANPTPDPSPLELALGSETVERYEKALRTLKPEDRELIIARVELCFDYEEIAREFDKPSANAARMAASRALRRLASKMGS